MGQKYQIRSIGNYVRAFLHHIPWLENCSRSYLIHTNHKREASNDFAQFGFDHTNSSSRSRWAYEFDLGEKQTTGSQTCPPAPNSPVCELIFGCHSFVVNFTMGGLNGYVSGIVIWTWKRPPSYGVFSGPVMYPVKLSTLSSWSSNFIDCCERRDEFSLLSE